jgi:hypothetical protein
MGNHIYNTDHGVFLLRKEKFALAFEALKTHAAAERPDTAPPKDLFEALRLFDWEASEADDGDIIDLYFADGAMRDWELDAVRKHLAPFVDPGSFLVFAFGEGTNCCWAWSFEKDPTTDMVTCSEKDVITVLDDDVVKMLKVLKVHAPGLFKEMEEKYASMMVQKELADG